MTLVWTKVGEYIPLYYQVIRAIKSDIGLEKSGGIYTHIVVRAIKSDTGLDKSGGNCMLLLYTKILDLGRPNACREKISPLKNLKIQLKGPK